MTQASARAPNNRQSDRREADEPSTLRGPEGLPADVHVYDISSHGFLCEADIDLKVGDDVTLGMGSYGSVAAVVRWTKDRMFGCEFVVPVMGAEAMAGLSGEVVSPYRFRTAPTPAEAVNPPLIPNKHVVLFLSTGFMLASGFFAARMMDIV